MVKILLALLLSSVLLPSNAYSKPKRQQSIPVPVTYMLWNIDDNIPVDVSGDAIRPIASITKLMSVYVTLSANLDPDEILTVIGNERSSRIRPGMRLTRDRLIELALVTSDNLAARTLAETYPAGYVAFIDAMNRSAMELGMWSTKYVDPTGLLADNISSPQDLMSLMLAVADLSPFNRAANTTTLSFTAVLPSKRRDREVEIRGANTNYLAGKLDILAAKTGYTSRAGRCLSMLFQQNGTRYYLLVMGAKSSSERQKTVQYLIDRIK